MSRESRGVVWPHSGERNCVMSAGGLSGIFNALLARMEGSAPHWDEQVSIIQ